MGFPGGSAAKNLPAMQETQENADSIPGSGRSPEGRNGNPLAWRIPGTQKPDGLQSTESQRVRCD